MSDEQLPANEQRGVIGFRTALILYALLAGVAVYTLKGMAMGIALLVVFALAAKTWAQHLKRKIE